MPTIPHHNPQPQSGLQCATGSASSTGSLAAGRHSFREKFRHERNFHIQLLMQLQQPDPYCYGVWSFCHQQARVRILQHGGRRRGQVDLLDGDEGENGAPKRRQQHAMCAGEGGQGESWHQNLNQVDAR